MSARRRKEVQKLKERVRFLEMSDDLWASLAAEIADVLNAYECGHGAKPASAGVPPMFYPEAIQCVVEHQRRLAASK